MKKKKGMTYPKSTGSSEGLSGLPLFEYPSLHMTLIDAVCILLSTDSVIEPAVKFTPLPVAENATHMSTTHKKECLRVDVSKLTFSKNVRRQETTSSPSVVVPGALAMVQFPPSQVV